ncbi:MAG: phage holin family protein [Oscillospiraceae bacterium]|nr:phage holin family protein [Oscillospiraceae bacterium]
MKSVIKILTAVAGGTAGFLFGETDGLLIALISFVCLDYISGVLVGASKRKLSSQIGYKGLCKKAMILVIVAMAHIIDSQVLGGSKSVFRSAVCCMFISNEGMSIIENAGKLGLPLPKKLKSFLEQLRDKSDKEE